MISILNSEHTCNKYPNVLSIIKKDTEMQKKN